MNILKVPQYEYGQTQEEKMLFTLKKLFPDIKRTQEKYADWDYIDETLKYKIELKSRRIRSTQYPSTIIGSNKIFKGQKEKLEGYKILYIFNYLDKIVYYRLKKKEKFNESFFNDKYHCFIPANKLKNIERIKI